MTKNRALSRTLVLLGLATLPLIVPVGAQQFSERAKKIGFQLKCMCGSCSMTAAGCSHPGGDFSGPCPTAKGMLQEAEQHIACMTRSSVSPLAMCCSASCNIPFAVGHGPEKSPPGCEQPAAVMLHEPHMHLS